MEDKELVVTARRRVAAVAAAVVALVAVGVVVAVRPGGRLPTLAGPAAAGPAGAPAARAGSAITWVAAENQRPGTTAWRITHLGTPDAIEGYADRASATWGERVHVYVSTTAPSFHVEAYRMGYYHGLGARLVWRSAAIPGRRQPPPVRTPGTNLLATHWPPALALPLTPTWPQGDYLLKLTAATGQRYVPLTIRDDTSHAALLIQNAVTTWQAYNAWGGASLYHGPHGNPATRSRVVSFDRPYDPPGLGAGDFLGNELPLVRLVEQHGLDVTYATDLDLHRHPERLLAHRALVSLGHDEYWSTRMRRGAETARAHGVNLAFLGANAVFRHIRLQPSPLGPDREEVNYKPWSAGDDPAWRSDPGEVTTDWRQPPLNDPESRLLGAQYQCNPVHASGVVVDPAAWPLAGTGVHAGMRLAGLVGGEYDGVRPGAPRPAGVQVLLHAPVRCRGPSAADTTYYTVPGGGAGVFDAGTGSWVCQLAGACAQGRNDPVTARVVGAVTLNLLRGFAQGPAGRHHPSRPNLTRLHVVPNGL
ncbi:MAG TPA: N,N-dimethylformamidase beta subunit family domain-containing protein [Actinomycetota bacterium]|nr:N,N-dimethylformamidase beta subunit family domain-containing protein [Actinomycetota bacterium]